MSTIFVDTTQETNGDGTFETPYNYLPPGYLEAGNTIYITMQSTLNEIDIDFDTEDPFKLIGYDPTVDTEYWEGDANADIEPEDPEIVVHPRFFPSANTGPIIYASKGEYCININTQLATMSETPLLTFQNLRLFGWSDRAILVQLPLSTMNLVQENVNTITPPANAGWRTITIMTV